MSIPLTSRQRLLTAFRRQQPDRVPIHVRGVPAWNAAWVESRDPSFAPVIEAVREKCDLVATWGVPESLFLTAFDLQPETRLIDAGDWTLHETTIHTPAGPLTSVHQVSKQDRPSLTKKFWVENEDDLKKFLSIPYFPLQPDVSGFAELTRQVGERALVLANYLNPIARVHDLLGSERLALWSMTQRAVVSQLVYLFTERLYHFLQYLLEKGVRGVYGTAGHEYAGPLLLAPRDFHEFVTRPEAEIGDLLHRHDCLLHVHCHGPLQPILEDFVTLGADCLHPIEAPPMGDMSLAEAKQRIGSQVCLEGNIQIGDLYAKTPGEIRDLVRQAIAEAAEGGGFILCPTASPYTKKLSPVAVENYLTMIEAGLEYGKY